MYVISVNMIKFDMETILDAPVLKVPSSKVIESHAFCLGKQKVYFGITDRYTRSLGVAIGLFEVFNIDLSIF